MARRRKARGKVVSTPTAGPSAASGAEDVLDEVENLIQRARRVQRRGDARRAIVLLRQATTLDPYRARTFTLLGDRLRRRGHLAEAEQTLRHALWLRSRAGEQGRANSTSKLLDDLAARAA